MALSHVQREELRSIMEQRGEALRCEMRRDMETLCEIAAARKRLAFGTYGICVECAREIPYFRLRADPAATRCIECEVSPARPLRQAGA